MASAELQGFRFQNHVKPSRHHTTIKDHGVCLQSVVSQGPDFFQFQIFRSKLRRQYQVFANNRIPLHSKKFKLSTYYSYCYTRKSSVAPRPPGTSTCTHTTCNHHGERHPLIFSLAYRKLTIQPIPKSGPELCS